MEFPEDETDKFYVGAEDNNLYQVNLHSSGSREQQVWKTFVGHQAPITKMSLHPGKSMTDNKASQGMITDMSELMLSSSMDWTVKLWYPKNEMTELPIATFEHSQEYVYDVQWSPVHPTVFAQVDGDGFLDIWNINIDMDSPIVHKMAFENQITSAAYKDYTDKRALNTLKWSRDGRRIAVGDFEGNVSIQQVIDKDLYVPMQGDFEFIENLIQKNQAKEDLNK
mmetsp:Transcript_2586/g.4337  ORF Transcript_2586/g.4337 Transcript_2586/m.4337 type:complete len:224 (+) Transcript_2586:1293-1964(+)